MTSLHPSHPLTRKTAAKSPYFPTLPHTSPYCPAAVGAAAQLAADRARAERKNRRREHAA
jgi:hypothetical protein